MKREDEIRELFTGLIRSHLGLYRKIAFQIVNSHADADDAVQTAFIRASVAETDAGSAETRRFADFGIRIGYS